MNETIHNTENTSTYRKYEYCTSDSCTHVFSEDFTVQKLQTSNGLVLSGWRPHFNLAVLLVLRYRNSLVDGPQAAAWINYL
jgi:hypothetical protein